MSSQSPSRTVWLGHSSPISVDPPGWSEHYYLRFLLAKFGTMTPVSLPCVAMNRTAPSFLIFSFRLRRHIH